MGALQRFERRLEGFERRLEGFVDNASARVFGGGVVPQEVAQALQREAEAGIRPLAGGRQLAPNRYTVTLGADDHSRLSGDRQRVIQLLRECVRDHLNEHGWETYGGVVVELERSETLHTGQFRTASRVDPDACAHVPAQPPTAGDRAMSQRPGYYPDDDQRGQYGGHNYAPGQHYGYPDDAGYARQGYDRNYGYDPQYGPNAYYGYDQGYGYHGSYGYDQQGYGYYGGYPPAPAPAPGGYGPAPAGPGQLTAALTVDDGSGRTYQIIQGSNIVGRGQDAQFRLPDTGVSRRHLDISWDGRHATLSDLGSTNGTAVNGNAVQTWQLADGDVIRIGHSALIFRSYG